MTLPESWVCTVAVSSGVTVPIALTASGTSASTTGAVATAAGGRPARVFLVAPALANQRAPRVTITSSTTTASQERKDDRRVAGSVP